MGFQASVRAADMAATYNNRRSSLGPRLESRRRPWVMPRVIRAGIKPAERNEGIRTGKGIRSRVDEYAATYDRGPRWGCLSRRVYMLGRAGRLR